MNNPKVRITLHLFFLAVLAQAFSVAAEPEAYTLTLDRPEAIGNYYKFKSEVYKSKNTTTTLNDQQLGEEKNLIEATMAGTAWVSQVNEQGEITEVVIYPNQYAGKIDAEDVEIVLNQRLFVQINNGAMKVFDAGGHNLSSKAVQILDLLLRFMVGADESELMVDDLFKLGEQHRPGASWQGDNQLLARSLNKAGGIEVEPNQIESTFSFAQIDKLFGKEAAKIEFEVKLSDYAAPGLVPQGFSISASEGSIKVQSTLPIDKRSTEGKFVKNIDMSLNAFTELPEDQGKVEVMTVISIKTSAECQIQD